MLMKACRDSKPIRVPPSEYSRRTGLRPDVPGSSDVMPCYAPPAARHRDDLITESSITALHAWQASRRARREPQPRAHLTWRLFQQIVAPTDDLVIEVDRPELAWPDTAGGEQ
jgi:hypothetical protein